MRPPVRPFRTGRAPVTTHMREAVLEPTPTTSHIWYDSVQRSRGIGVHGAIDRCGAGTDRHGRVRRPAFPDRTTAACSYATRLPDTHSTHATLDQRPNGWVPKGLGVARRIVCKVAVRPVSTRFRRRPPFPTMSWSNEAISIVGGTRLGPDGLHQTQIPRGQGWARAVEGSGSLGPVARDVGMAVSGGGRRRGEGRCPWEGGYRGKAASGVD